MTIEAREDDPVAAIRVFDMQENDDGEMVAVETETMVGHVFSTLTKIEPPQMESTANTEDKDNTEEKEVKQL